MSEAGLGTVELLPMQTVALPLSSSSQFQAGKGLGVAKLGKLDVWSSKVSTQMNYLKTKYMSME